MLAWIGRNFFGMALESRPNGMCGGICLYTKGACALQKTWIVVHGLLHGLIHKVGYHGHLRAVA